MTVRVKPLVGCDKPGCKAGAVHQTTFIARRGEQNGPKVCDKHIGWGKQRAREIRDS